MKTNKIAAILLVASFALAGCGNNADTTEPADTSAETKVEEKADDAKATTDEKAEDAKEDIDQKADDAKNAVEEEKADENK